MNVAEIMEQRNAFSFEVFPPKTDVGMEKLCGEGGVLEKLYTLNPDYISCTYGAGGTNVGKNLEVLKKIKADGKCTPVTHFTCVANTKEGIKDQLQTYLDNGIDHMLALRGDIPFGWTGTNGDLHYATELVKFVRKEFGDKFTIAVAGSPEGHIACRSLEADISFLKQKQDEGALPQWLRDVPRPVRDHLQELDLPESVRSERVRGVHRCQEGVLQGSRHRVYHQAHRRVSRLRHQRHPSVCPEQV